MLSVRLLRQNAPWSVSIVGHEKWSANSLELLLGSNLEMLGSSVGLGSRPVGPYN